MSTTLVSSDSKSDDIWMPTGHGKYNNTWVGWLEKRSKYVKKWRSRFCVLKMSHCLILTYKYEFDEVTNITLLNDKKNQTDSVLFGDISKVQEIELDVNGEEYDYDHKKPLEKSTQWAGFKVFIDADLEQQDIIENKRHSFECQYEGFAVQTIQYQKKDFDEYVFRCKSIHAVRHWIDLISDCIIRAKYYNYNALHNSTFHIEPAIVMDVAVTEHAYDHQHVVSNGSPRVIPNSNHKLTVDARDREIKYYRLLLGLPHNQKLSILWERLGVALSLKHEKDLNVFNACCNAFETAHSLHVQDSKILYNFITALDNFSNIDIFTQERISKTLTIYNRIQEQFNAKSLDYYGFCKFLFENQLYRLLENILDKLLNPTYKGNLDYFAQISYWTKLIHIYDMDDAPHSGEDEENDEQDDVKEDEKKQHRKWKYLLKIKKCYQFKMEQQDIQYWEYTQVMQYIHVLIDLKHYQPALIYVDQLLERNANHVEARTLRTELTEIIKQNKNNGNIQNENDEQNLHALI